MSSSRSEQVASRGRRELLQVGAAASVGSVLGGCARPAPEGAAPQGPARTLELPGAEDLVPSKMPTGFSKAELERRWARVREWMKKADFDCLIVPERPEGDADVKYLTESAANWVVFPQSGRPTSIFRRIQEADEAKQKMGLDLEMRVERFNRSQVIVECLKEAGVSRGRVGVGDLAGTMRNDEGGVSYTSMARLKEGLPGVTFESAVELLMNVKLARGPEEIEVLRLVSRVSELSLRAIVETAGPGVPQRDVWFQAFKALLDASGEAPGGLSIRSGYEANTARGRPLDEAMQAGQIIGQEASGTVLGYCSQVNHSMCVGPPAPADWKGAFSYVVEVFEKLVDWAAPGKSFAEYAEFYRGLVEKRTSEVGGEPYWGVVFHTGGALGDGPRMGPGRDDENADRVIEAGMVFTIKPRVPIVGVEAPNAQVGDPVLITENGAERLGRRKLELITLGA